MEAFQFENSDDFILENENIVDESTVPNIQKKIKKENTRTIVEVRKDLLIRKNYLGSRDRVQTIKADSIDTSEEKIDALNQEIELKDKISTDHQEHSIDGTDVDTSSDFQNSKNSISPNEVVLSEINVYEIDKSFLRLNSITSNQNGKNISGKYSGKIIPTDKDKGSCKLDFDINFYFPQPKGSSLSDNYYRVVLYCNDSKLTKFGGDGDLKDHIRQINTSEFIISSPDKLSKYLQFREINQNSIKANFYFEFNGEITLFGNGILKKESPEELDGD